MNFYLVSCSRQNMLDRFSKEVRSRIMASIRSKNTKPELKVRQRLWTMGKRYRVHDRTIYGTPDISNKGKKIAIFIDGCFWHGCKKCYTKPKTNTVFWDNKIKSNKKRRHDVIRSLKREGWKIFSVWEHDVNKNPDMISKKIADFM